MKDGHTKHITTGIHYQTRKDAITKERQQVKTIESNKQIKQQENKKEGTTETQTERTNERKNERGQPRTKESQNQRYDDRKT